MEGVKVAEWLGMGEDFENGIAGIRREKRTVPDSEKDEKYWEKRERNNLAAKRSRENKRLIEMSTKTKANILERENSFLKREIEALKKMFGLPLNGSFLSKEEQEDFQNSRQRNERKRIKLEKDFYSDEKNMVPYPVAVVVNQRPLSPNNTPSISRQASRSYSNSNQENIKHEKDRICHFPLREMSVTTSAASDETEHTAMKSIYKIPSETSEDLKLKLAQFSAQMVNMKYVLEKR